MMKALPNLFVGLFLWVALVGNHFAFEVTTYPRYVHIKVQRIDANVTISIGWRSHSGQIWPLVPSTLRLRPDCYDRWNGHSIARPWGCSTGAEEGCREFQASQVRITTDGNKTTGWLSLPKGY